MQVFKRPGGRPLLFSDLVNVSAHGSFAPFSQGDISQRVMELELLD